MLEGDCRGKPDSQVALKALDGYLVRSREVLRCRQLLKVLSRANSVRLLWVPGHFGGVCNEKTDRLANRGDKSVRVRRCGVGLPGCSLKERLEEWLGKMTALRWQEKKGMTRNKTWLAKVRKLERRRLRFVVGWLTEH